MQLDPKINTKTVFALAPAVYAATQTTTEIDARGYEYAKIIVLCGALADTATLAVKVQDSPTTTAGDFVDVAGASLTVTTTADDSSVQIGIVRLHGKRRYLRLVGTYGGTGNVAYAIAVELYSPDYSKSLEQTPDFEVL